MTIFRRRGKDGKIHIVVNKKTKKKNNDNLYRLAAAAIGLGAVIGLTRDARKGAALDKVFNAEARASSAAADAAANSARALSNGQHDRAMKALEIKNSVDRLAGGASGSVRNIFREAKIDRLRARAAEIRNK
jgi:hypothetical protein